MREGEKVALRLLQWKFDHPGITSTAINHLKKGVLPDLPSWYKIVTAAARLAPDVKVVNYPCCVKSCYASTTDPPDEACPHCKEPLFVTTRHGVKKPRKLFPWFPLAPRLARQWLDADRAELLRYRVYETQLGMSNVATDYIHRAAYREMNSEEPNNPVQDPYSHFLAISMDGFQVFKV